MRVVVGADHAGYEMKEMLKHYVERLGHNVVDVGTNSTASVDYPDFARALGEALAAGQAQRGVLICGSGVGASIAVNKIPGVRAAICHDAYSARQGVEHDDMNVLTLGARIVGEELAKELVKHFLAATFSEEERHVRRLGKLKDIESDYMQL